MTPLADPQKASEHFGDLRKRLTTVASIGSILHEQLRAIEISKGKTKAIGVGKRYLENLRKASQIFGSVEEAFMVREKAREAMERLEKLTGERREMGHRQEDILFYDALKIIKRRSDKLLGVFEATRM